MPAHSAFQPHPLPVFYPFLTKSGNYTLAPLLVWVFRPRGWQRRFEMPPTQSANHLSLAAMHRIILPFILLMGIASCRPPSYTPKPPGYYKIDTPAAHNYRVFSKPGFPYTFEYPTYAEIVQDSSLEEKAENPYWLNIYIPGLGGVINFTYKEINAKQSLSDLIVRSYDLTSFHHQKSAGEESKEFYNGANVFVMTFSLGGDAASKFQFIATDSVKHFVRGALYFDVTPNADSLQPAYDFVQRDIEHMLMTLRWQGPNSSVRIPTE